MGHSKIDKAESRERILAEASRRIRESGPDGLAIAPLMQAAGLTHGGFYAHFASRESLIEAALERALADGERASMAARKESGSGGMAGLARSYLSRAHRDHPETGCAIAALAGDVERMDEGARKIMQQALGRFIARTETLAGTNDTARDNALAAWSTLVGGLVLSRALAGTPLSDAVLEAARKQVASL